MRSRSSRPIVVLVAVLLALQVLIMGAGIGGIATVEAVRGFVVGEAQYTKAQQRATSALRRYVMTGAAAEIVDYHREMAVPRRIGLARIVLEIPGIPDRYAYAFLVEGNIHPADVPFLVTMYQVASGTGLLAPAIDAWQNGDRLIQKLDALALRIEASYAGDSVSPDRRQSWLARIDRYDSELTRYQDAFARHMGEATRSVRAALISGIAGGTALLVGLGLLVARRTIRTIDEGERAQIEGRRRFKDVAECAADWFWETDADHRFTYLSHRLKAVLGVEPTTCLGLTRAEANGGDASDGRWDELHRLMDERLPVTDFEYDHFDGTRWRRIRISGRPFFGSNGRFRGYRGAGRDVTAEREAAEKLERAKTAAEAANRAKSEFLANMSHELRTPLNSIIGFSEVMRDRILGPLDQRYAGYAGDINRSGHHLLQVINDILDLSRVEAGRIALQRTWVDLTDETEQVVRLLSGAGVDGNIAVHNRVDAGLPLVFVDAQRLRQILLNLIGNALKFSRDGDSVTVTAEASTADVRVRVTDTGAGIAKDQIARVLEPFGQADQSLARSHDGVGLGLALVKRFAELHGGGVEIDSEPGTGTTVTVTLAAGVKPKARTAGAKVRTGG